MLLRSAPPARPAGGCRLRPPCGAEGRERSAGPRPPPARLPLSHRRGGDGQVSEGGRDGEWEGARGRPAGCLPAAPAHSLPAGAKLCPPPPQAGGRAPGLRRFCAGTERAQGASRATGGVLRGHGGGCPPAAPGPSPLSALRSRARCAGGAAGALRGVRAPGRWSRAGSGSAHGGGGN